MSAVFKIKKIFFCYLIFFVFIPFINISLCEASGTNNPAFSISIENWISSGSGEWQIDANLTADTAFRSLLEWKKLDSAIMVLKADYRLTDEMRLESSYGFGSIRDGNNTDTDWLISPDLDPSLYKFSESISETSGDTSFFLIDIFMNILPLFNIKKDSGIFIDGIIGYLYYEDSISDRNGIQTVVNESSVYEPFEGLNATYDFKWQTARIGLKTGYSFASDIMLSLQTIVLINAEQKGEGFWVLREDLRSKSPNMINDISNGWGMDVEISLSYLVTDILSLEAGWRLLYLEARNGINTSFFSDETTEQSNLDYIKSERSGFFIGITGKF